MMNLFARLKAFFASSTPAKPSESARPKPSSAAPSKSRLESLALEENPIGAKIVEFEARRDGGGFPVLYKLPANDGGGAYEIAGINSKYHPAELTRLRAMPPHLREAECAQYIEAYTRGGTGLFKSRQVCRKGTLFFILDTAFNRGAGGACRVVQDALVTLGFTMQSMGGKGWGMRTRAALAVADKRHAAHIVSALRQSRESYERKVVGYRENFWNGLVNRWNKAEAVALAWNATSAA